MMITLRKPVEGPSSHYEKMIIPSEVKITPNPAYVVP